MSFLAMIIALVLLQIWGSGSRVQYDEWLERLQSSLRGLGLSSTTCLLLSIAAPVTAASIVLALLEPILFGLVWIAATVLILLYSFGRGDFQVLLARYRSYCEKEDFEGAYLHAQSELGNDAGEQGADSPGEFLLQVQRFMLYEGYQRWFAVLFYFVVLGPEAALAYRLLHLAISTPGSGEGVAQRLLFIADWVPVRLLAATFTLTGDFVHSRNEFLASFQNIDEAARSILFVVGRAAMGMDGSKESGVPESFGKVAASQLADLGALLSRSATSWLVLISLFVLLL